MKQGEGPPAVDLYAAERKVQGRSIHIHTMELKSSRTEPTCSLLLPSYPPVLFFDPSRPCDGICISCFLIVKAAGEKAEAFSNRGYAYSWTHTKQWYWGRKESPLVRAEGCVVSELKCKMRWNLCIRTDESFPAKLCG